MASSRCLKISPTNSSVTNEYMLTRVLVSLISGFAIVSGLVTFSFGQTTTSPTWRVQKYDLDVTLPADSGRSIPVKAVLSVKNVTSRPATTLTLRISPTAEVTAVKVNDATADFAKSEEKINAGTTLQRIAIRFAGVAPGAVVAATVDYKINVKENSGLISVAPNASHFLPLSFWYPTPNSWFFTQGADRAPVHLKVNTSGVSIASAGIETLGGFDNKMLGQPFFATGNWEVTNLSGVTVMAPKAVSPESAKRASELAALLSEARTFMSTILGKAPDVPLRIVSSRRGAGYGSGGMVIVDEAVFRRSRVDSLTAMNIAEAAAKLWLGDSIAITGDGYGIIGEGLTRYLATQFIESKFGKDVADIERTRQRNSYAAISKRDAPMTVVSPIDDYYYPEVANKGAMAWRIIAKRLGPTEFSKMLAQNSQDGDLNIAELRMALAEQKPIVDYFFDKITDMNLLAGLPQVAGGESRVALRNTGSTDVTVDVLATTETGERLTAPASLRATSFGEVSFRTPSKIVRVEIDADKLYPQIDYSDDIAPRDVTDSDPLLAVKRSFDKQEYEKAEATARLLLKSYPRFDDLRVLLGRSLLAENKNSEAEREFKAVLDEKLPTSRSLAWANVGLAETASRANQTEAALKYADAAIVADGEYGANLTARNLRTKLGYATAGDAAVKEFFAAFDRAAASNRKADLDALALPGEVTKFVGGISGSTEQWQTQVRQIDRIDANTVLVEAGMSIKLLNKEVETGTAVYRLTKVGTAWKLSAVEMFEVR